jgi:hypothetical protein
LEWIRCKKGSVDWLEVGKGEGLRMGKRDRLGWEKGNG